MWPPTLPTPHRDDFFTFPYETNGPVQAVPLYNRHERKLKRLVAANMHHSNSTTVDYSVKYSTFKSDHKIEICTTPNPT